MSLSKRYDVCVIGAGPAGMAAAVAARHSGAARVLMVDRDSRMGGVLPQCVHDGFGLHLYGRSLTGPEYAERWSCAVGEAGVEVCLGTSVLGVSAGADGGFDVDVAGSAAGGRASVHAASVVVATGCRERTRGQLMIPGTRPSGVMTAGEAQYLVNRKNLLPGDKVVVLGSGDIGLIMARRLTLEGAEVRLVLGQEATGLLRNHVRCIDDFGIPIRYGWGVVSVHGAGRLSGVTVAPLADDGSFDLACKEYVRCNLLLLACGLIPEREVLGSTWEVGLGTDAAGLFVCGNADVPHDLVDKVTQEGLRAGLAAARHVLGDAARSDTRIDELLGVLVREPKGRLSELRESGSAGRPIACTVCPTGCIVFADDRGNLSGYSCNRGRDFARSEIERPMRLFTGTVKSRSGKLVPVRTSAEVEREKLLDVARACRRVRVGDGVRLGDVVARDVAGTGADLLACSGAHADGLEGKGA